MDGDPFAARFEGNPGAAIPASPQQSAPQPAGPTGQPAATPQPGQPQLPPGSAAGSTHEGDPGFSQDRGVFGNLQQTLEKGEAAQAEAQRRQDEAAQRWQESHNVLAAGAEKVNRALAIPTQAPPQLQKVAPPPPAMTQKDGQAMVAFAGAMALIGAIGSRFTHMPAEAALSAFGSALKGYKEGNQAQFENSYKEWEAQTKATINNNQTLLDQYRQVLENKKLDIEHMRAAWQNVALVNQDQIGLSRFIADNAESRANYYNKLFSAQTKLVDTYGKMQRQTGGAGMPMDAETIKGMVGQWRAGNESVTRQFGPGLIGAQNRAAFWKEAIAEDNAAGVTPQQRAATFQRFKADQAAQRTLATREVNIETAVQDMQNLIPFARQANHAFPRSDFMPFGSLEREGARITSNPDYLALESYTQAVKTAYASSMSRGSVTPVAAMARADHLLNSAVGTKGYDRALEILQNEGEQIRRAPEQVRERMAAQILGGGPASEPAAAAPAVATKPRRVEQNGHIYEEQSDGSMKAIQ